MNILKPNNGEEVQFIVSGHVYIKVWDYGKTYILTHLKIPNINTPLSETIWAWISLDEGVTTDLSELSHSSFEDAINKAVNNPYCTVYAFDTYRDMAKHWEEIIYLDTITTTYKREKECTDY